MRARYVPIELLVNEVMADMMDLALVVARAVTDTGKSHTLTDVIAEERARARRGA